MPSRPAAWLTWPAIASARSCASEPSVSASPGGEAAPAGLLVAQPGGERLELLELGAGLARLLRVGLGDRGAHVVVDQHEAAEDVGDVLQPRGGDERALLGVGAGHEARVLPGLEVLGHGRRHHHERGERVLRRRLPLARRGVELGGIGREVARGRHEEVGVGQRLAEADLAVAVEVGLHALAPRTAARCPTARSRAGRRSCRAARRSCRRACGSRTARRSPGRTCRRRRR